jgi:hypothetical protein
MERTASDGMEAAGTEARMSAGRFLDVCRSVKGKR